MKNSLCSEEEKRKKQNHFFRSNTEMHAGIYLTTRLSILSNHQTGEIMLEKKRLVDFDDDDKLRGAPQ